MSDPDRPDHRPPQTPELFPAPVLSEQVRMVEALLFASAQPLSLRDLGSRMPPGSDPAAALDALAKLYEGRGVALFRAGDGWAFRTAPDLAGLMQHEVEETRKLSRAAIETLAIIAYHQPVTRAEIEEIRGVSVSRGTLDQLIGLEWVKLGRRRETPGRPVTFVVTDLFLDHFGLGSVRDLPGVKDLKAAGLLEARPAPEEDGPDQGSDAAEDVQGAASADMFDQDDTSSGT